MEVVLMRARRGYWFDMATRWCERRMDVARRLWGTMEAWGCAIDVVSRGDWLKHVRCGLLVW